LETTNRSTHGRLGNAKFLRRGGQRARLRDLDQHAELFKARFLEPLANLRHRGMVASMQPLVNQNSSMQPVERAAGSVHVQLEAQVPHGYRSVRGVRCVESSSPR